MRAMRALRLVLGAPLLLSAFSGCATYGERGALLGGLAGAGVGTAIGDAVGNEGAGALIGAGVGALSGAAIGTGLDEVEAKNRAAIATQLGRQVQPGAVSMQDAIAMTKAGVDEDLIAGHIRANGIARPLQAQDLITLQNEGVSKSVIQALQTSTAPQAGAVAVPVAGPPVVVEEHYYGPPVYWGYPYPRYRHCHPRPRVGWGVSVGSGF